MKVYITYDRYEYNEYFNIYQITTRMSEVRKDYKKNLIDFISYRPDDCHSYQIQIVNLTKKEYELLKSHVDNTIDDDDEFMELMIKIYEDPDSDCLICTDGCSDNNELVNFWIEYNGLDEYDEDQIEEDLNNDGTFYDKVLKKYINYTYQI